MTIDLTGLLESWALQLRAERKSPKTVEIYTAGVRRFLRWADETGNEPLLNKPTVNLFIADLIDGGNEAATVLQRQLSMRRFSKWLAEENEIPADQLVGMRPVKLDAKLVHPLEEAEIKAMIAACSGSSEPFRDRRDEALIRMMTECGLRAGEALALKVVDVDLTRGIATVHRGKGGKGRIVAFGPQTSRAIDRYVRARRTHRLAASDALWLGDRGGTLGYDGMRKSLNKRADTAGVQGFHPHRFRHAFANRWLSAGGSESGLQAMAGWSSPAMLGRYTRAQASDRAAEESRKLNLGDI